MADADGLSSPDPLGDEPPSSARTSYTQRTANYYLPPHEPSTISIPRSSISPRKTSPMKRSPRKRIFELDVGNEISPQKILVTVEAEEALRRGLNRGLNRRLFQPSSSPIRGDRRREAITTTTVPLNDEAEDDNDSAPRRRGRPRRTSNGTPMPRGKKRAGTPIQRTAKQTRLQSDPASEANIVDDGSTTANAGATPKPRAKPRKTPKTTSTTLAVPSSQLSTNATKRKRGRPRKAPMPEEVAELADAGDKSNVNVANVDTTRSAQEDLAELPSSVPGLPSDILIDSDALQEMVDGYGADPDDLAGERDRTPTPANISRSIRRDSESRTQSHQEEQTDDLDIGMSDNYPPMEEPHSDLESNMDDFDGVPHSGQDTLAHASDFSMIAVESLPSFQASFQASRNHVPSDFPGMPEMGEETSLIINQTLESLRRSTQTEAAHQSPIQQNSDDLSVDENRTDALDGSLQEINGHGLQGRSRSPRKQKPLPLNRRVLAAKVRHVDDSFSSIPDSILRAATPGRLPMKQTSATERHENSGMHDDSFSEIPEEILEAATPRPPSRTAAPTEETRGETPASQGHSSSANRSAGSNFGSSRLPTPEDTSSSNAGSKRGHEDEIGLSIEAQNEAGPSSNAGIRSSPPVINRPRAMDFGPSQLDREMNNTPELQQSSPQLPPSSKAPAEPAKSLEPPVISRPSLSPIVRVGRTLQNVMSDRSSPEGREGSLGSPFRSSAGNEHQRPLPSDHSGQPSTSNLLARSNHSIPNQSTTRFPFNINSALAQQATSSFAHGGRPTQSVVIGSVEDPFGPDRPDYSETEALKRSAYNTNGQVSHPGHPATVPSVTSSTRALPSEDDMSWAADGDDPQQETNQESNSQPIHSQNSSFATRGSNESKEMDMDMDEIPDSEMVEDPQQREGDNGTFQDYDEDEDDLWDFEASRPSPEKSEPIQTAPQPDTLPARRSKIPSPWRRTSRRLIYQNEITSPSQIEIEESPQSEAEESLGDAPLERARQRPSNSQSKVQGKQPEPPIVDEPLSHQPESPAQQENLSSRSNSPEPESPEPGSPQQESHQLESHQLESHQLESHQLESPEPDRSQPKTQEKAAEPVDASEYSILAQRTKDALNTQNGPTPAKSRLFGGFNILSFFSSPATLPQKDSQPGQSGATREAERAAQNALERPRPKEPQQSLWSTGLFPSIPQKEFQPSPERRTDLFSPMPALPSNDAAPDTYEEEEISPSPAPEASPSPAPSRSPEPESPQSARPSTPERHIYPTIEQKRNFTPRPGQSGGSLFRTGPTTSRSETDSDHLQMLSDELESSRMTDDTEYERLPPREKPSRWDRTLSPSKSCFRSPLKPTTPGRVVAFTGTTLSPTTQAQAQAEKRQTARGRGNVLFQGPFPQPSTSKGEENAPTASTSTFRRAPTAHSNTVPTTSVDNSIPTTSNNNNDTSNANPVTQPSRPTASTTTITSTATSSSSLSQTEWTRQHWTRLDSLLQLRRRDPLDFRQKYRIPPRSERRALEAGLVGKEVSAQGQSVVLESWHLEVVHAFRAEVGNGWTARELAKRVFALLAGEERRRKGSTATGVNKSTRGRREVSA
ncbi:hypothetical protein AAE478_005621 [Parahypoxylon ruwenzoriense]